MDDGFGIRSGGLRDTKAEAERDAQAWRKHIAGLKRKPRGTIHVITEEKLEAMMWSCKVTPHTSAAEDAEIVARARQEVA